MKDKILKKFKNFLNCIKLLIITNIIHALLHAWQPLFVYCLNNVGHLYCWKLSHKPVTFHSIWFNSLKITEQNHLGLLSTLMRLFTQYNHPRLSWPVLPWIISFTYTDYSTKPQSHYSNLNVNRCSVDDRLCLCWTTVYFSYTVQRLLRSAARYVW